MNKFYIMRNEDNTEILIGGTKRDVNVRWLEHNNNKTSDGNWVGELCEEVDNYNEIERHFQTQYAKLLTGGGKERFKMSSEEGEYIFDIYSNKPTGMSPFALKFMEGIQSADATPVDVESLTPMQTRPETSQKHVERLKESIEINGFLPLYPIIIWPNKGTNRVVSGNHRTWAAQEMEIDEIPAHRIPKYFDNETVKCIGWIANSNHTIALALTDRAIKTKIQEDYSRFGGGFINDEKEGYMALFRRNARSIGKFVGSVVREGERAREEVRTGFRYDKKVIDELKSKLIKENPDSYIAMIDAKNWRDQMGGAVLKAVAEEKDNIIFRQFRPFGADSKARRELLERIALDCVTINSFGIKTQVEEVEQYDK